LREADSEGCPGKVLFEKLTSVLKEFGLDFNNFMGLGTDGASAMVGEGKGLRGWVHVEAPWVFGIHCAAHRLHLAAGDMLKSDEFMQFLEVQNTVTDAVNFIRDGSKRGSYFFELQVQRKEKKPLTPPQPNDTRWWSVHKVIRFFMLRYGAILQAFREWRKTSEEGNRIYEIIKTFKFVVNVSALEVVMSCMTPLSEEFQKSDFTALSLQPALNRTYAALDLAVHRKTVRQRVRGMIKQQGLSYGGVDVVLGLTMDVITGRYVQYSKLCIQARFPSMQTLEDLSVVFDPSRLKAARQLPGTQYEDHYGDEEWLRLVNQFFPAKNLGTDSAEYRDTIPDWHSVKVAIKWNLRRKMRTADDVCRWILRNERFNRTDPQDYCLAFTAIMLARITLVLPPTNAGVERGFSTMNDIKCPGRSRLSENILNKLMFIRMHTGQDLQPSILSAAVTYWKDAKKRRGLSAFEENDLQALINAVKYVKEKRLDEVKADIVDRVEEEAGERIAE
jgi:hypothetical protein